MAHVRRLMQPVEKNQALLGDHFLGDRYELVCRDEGHRA